ncbi:hypothetical protein [Mesorhizobium sp.]|uniref:hypothetical protein n=1 Tax=Mesorhizobium sp. TaxID=1871066 RepID=UPI00342D0564
MPGGEKGVADGAREFAGDEDAKRIDRLHRSRTQDGAAKAQKLIVGEGNNILFERFGKLGLPRPGNGLAFPQHRIAHLRGEQGVFRALGFGFSHDGHAGGSRLDELADDGAGNELRFLGLVLDRLRGERVGDALKVNRDFDHAADKSFAAVIPDANGALEGGGLHRVLRCLRFNIFNIHSAYRVCNTQTV